MNHIGILSVCLPCPAAFFHGFFGLALANSSRKSCFLNLVSSKELIGTSSRNCVFQSSLDEEETLVAAVVPSPSTACTESVFLTFLQVKSGNELTRS